MELRARGHPSHERKERVLGLLVFTQSDPQRGLRQAVGRTQGCAKRRRLRVQAGDPRPVLQLTLKLGLQLTIWGPGTGIEGGVDEGEVPLDGPYIGGAPGGEPQEMLPLLRLMQEQLLPLQPLLVQKLLLLVQFLLLLLLFSLVSLLRLQPRQPLLQLVLPLPLQEQPCLLR